MTTPERLRAEHEFEDVTFSDFELERADLSGKSFTGCTFRRVKLPESRWKAARLEDCTFDACDVSRMVPTQVRLIGVTFTGSKVMGVDWSSVAQNPSVTFEECDLRYASFVRVNLKKTAIRRCRALEANFIGCNLSEADFSGTTLTGTVIEDCDLTKADFETAISAFINPVKNRVKGATISVDSAALLAMSYGMNVAGYERE